MGAAAVGSGEKVRNIAIIAHVDHGKTTLVDCLLRQSDLQLNTGGEDRVMDSNVLEKERGITILAKCTSVTWNGHLINIVDTPGHADFGGEVERIMSMVDGVALVVDATDGVMTQTKFVLSKALARGLKPFVVVNKVDRPTSRLGDVEAQIFDLFANLGATDEQLDFPIIYASAKQGWAVKESSDVPKMATGEMTSDMKPLYEMIVKHVPAPTIDPTAPFRMLVTTIDRHPFFGKTLLGRIQSGRVKINDVVRALDPKAGKIEDAKVVKILARRGLEQVAVSEAQAGDIVSLAGFSTASVNATLCDPSVKEPLPSTPIDPPTLAMAFGANDSPFAGKEGKAVTTADLFARMAREAEENVSIRVMSRDKATDNSFEVHGRGELQLGVIIETLRREGYELSVFPPRVVYSKSESGERLEPLEEVVIDVLQEHTGTVLEKMSFRLGEVKEITQIEGNRSRMVFEVPTRGLLGYRTEFQNDTRGSGVLNHSFLKFVSFRGEMNRPSKGAMISIEEGTASAFALDSLQDRGPLFVEPGTGVYTGMVIGEHTRENDIEVNPTKKKALSNVRSTSKEDAIKLTPPILMSIEQAIAYVRDDEIIEVTPKCVRLRKQILDLGLRKRSK